MGFESEAEEAQSRSQEKLNTILKDLEELQSELDIISKGNYVEAYLVKIDDTKIEILKMRNQLRVIKKLI